MVPSLIFFGGCVSSAANDYIRHNAEKLSRIYPAGVRTDSSNYNPVPLWNAGCQMVALNFQTACSDMDLNQARFQVNGKSGYILKPSFMRDAGTDFDPITLTRGDWLQHKTLHIMVEYRSRTVSSMAPSDVQMLYSQRVTLPLSDHIGPAAAQGEQEEILHRGPAG